MPRAGRLASVQFSGDAKRRFALLDARSEKLRPAFQVIAARMLTETQKNFRAHGRRDQATSLWPPLSPVTLKLRKARKGVSGKGTAPLVASGDLFKSLIQESGNRYAEVGTNLPYAGDHQQHGNWGGARNVRRTVKIPAHMRKMWVRRDFTEAKRAAARIAGAVGRQLSIGDDIKRHGQNATIGKLLKQRRDATKKARKRGQRHRAVKALARAHAPKLKDARKSRAGKRRVDVQVKAHTQFWDVRVPARPFLWLHTQLIDRARKTLRKHLTAKKGKS